MNRQMQICLLSLLFFPCLLKSQNPPRYAVIMDEVFADPTPTIGLPNAEFIEIRNVSGTTYNLRNWKISDGTSTAVIRTSYELKPDSILILCSTGSAAAYHAFGAALGITGFPSLNNNGDTISLISSGGNIIHAIGYSKGWYKNDVKSDGGWSLEMIDTKNPCGGQSNWTASTNPDGGSPGKINSVDGSNLDSQPPALLRTYTISDTSIVAVFDEALDSLSAANIENFHLGNIPLTASFPQNPILNEVELRLSKPMQKNIVYPLQVGKISDCSGNTIGIMNTGKAGIPVEPDSLIINEILFNPKSNGFDYVEIYNKGSGPVDLSQVVFAGRDITNQLSDVLAVKQSPWLLFPGDFLCITENKNWLEQNYLVKDEAALAEVSALPSLPDDAGIFVLANRAGKIADELHYDHHWHFALIDMEDGVSLERISYMRPTQDASNWTSAASTAGYGTPGYKNSQSGEASAFAGETEISPKVFSPDNDGYQDYCFIRYAMPEPGYVANITIFDAGGRVVRYLAVNATLGLTGTFRWDGLNEQGQLLHIGNYILVTDLFNLSGKRKTSKQVVTLAKKF